VQRVSIVIILFLFVVASVPWLVSSCTSQPLLPLQLSEERSNYETRVAVAQQATLAAQRAATSLPPRVVPIGTLSPAVATAIFTPTINVPAAPLTATTDITTNDQITSTDQVTSMIPRSQEILGFATAVMPTSSGANSSATILRSATVTQTATPVSTAVVARSTPPAAPPQAVTVVPVGTTDSTVTTTLAVNTPAAISNTRGMTAVEDIITEEMLRDQVQKGDTDGSFSDIVVRITPDGLRVTGNAVVMLLQRRFTMTGTFVIENESLIVNIDSILLNGIDVTSQYRVQLESEIRSQLYQLLPQRFVQSFALEDGQVVVQSLKR